MIQAYWVSAIIIGAVVGLFACLIVEKNSGSAPLFMIVGVLGSLIGYFLYFLLFLKALPQTSDFNLFVLVVQIFGAIILLSIFKKVTPKEA